jgi:hypothetical protein
MSDVKSSAVLSPDGVYRYRLDRVWGAGPRVLFVMLNPSTADATQDDPTLRRCLGFARDWGYGSLTVANLYAYRATEPADLKRAVDPVGPECDYYLEQCAGEASLIVAAWGMHAHPDRVQQVRHLLGPEVMALAWTKAGQPRHPLYIKGDTVPQPWAP